jgi:uncharacterized protein
MKRTTFLKSIATGTLLMGLYSWQVEPFWLEFVFHKMPIPNLPNDLVGKTVMQISDMHIGHRFDKQYIKDSFKKAQQFNPDFVVYTGDFVSYKNAQQFAELKEVFEHVVIGKMGTVGVLGNHDYGKKWSESDVANKIVDILAEKGVQILRNEQKMLNGLNIIGIDDYWGTNFKPADVMQAFNPALANLALCHNPDAADEPIWNGYNSWILSGHTHGGQFKPPFLPPPVIPVKNRKYTAGKFELSGERTLYINRALGNLWQLRFNVRPEITIFELAAV